MIVKSPYSEELNIDIIHLILPSIHIYDFSVGTKAIGFKVFSHAKLTLSE